ncbi:restriction endonuclease [Streptomyces sp. NPDC056191]|uniref:restriction endonuclease n=1 Tax=Streptomyces sp. NPDC056191 TaxID=3345742 RepID=UPI0035DECA09
MALTPDGRRLVIQCKRYRDSNKVGSQDLQRFGGTCFTVHGADVAAVVTTSTFTKPAAGYAK